MKIENTGSLRPGNLKKASTLSKSGKSDFVSHLGEEEKAIDSLSSLSSLNPLESLFVLQEITEDQADRRKAYRKATTLLEKLEDLRFSLLEGKLPLKIMQNLQKLVMKEKEINTDPKIQEILQDIELRVMVELAKFQKSQLQNKN